MEKSVSTNNVPRVKSDRLFAPELIESTRKNICCISISVLRDNAMYGRLIMI